METLTITLAGQKFQIQPLTVGQLQDLEVGRVLIPPESTSETDLKDFLTKKWERSIALLATALSADHPNLTSDTLRKMRLGNVQAVESAVGQVMEFAGLVVKQEPQPGEAPATEG